MAIPTINFSGYVFDDAGEAVVGATVNLYEKNTTSTSLDDDTTDENGRWDLSYATQGKAGLDVQISNSAGSSKRRLKYDDKIHLAEVDTALLNVRAIESGAAAMFFYADEGENAGDRWKFNAADGGVFTILNDASGQASYAAHVTITPNSTASNSTFAVAGNLTVGNALTVTGTTTLNGNLVLGDAVATDTLSIGATLQGGTPLVFEGATANGYETHFVITDPTADRNITFPDLGGTVQLSGNPISGTTGTFSGVVDITDTTDSSDASGDTGALRTEGGASIAKKLYVGTDLDVDGTAELDNITIAGAQGNDGEVLTSTGSGVGWEAVSSTASVATTVTITDNESTNEDNAIIFAAGGDVDGGNLGLESDGTLTYNPSTGKITATGFIGSLTGTADTATVATTVTITDNESTNEDNAIIFTAGGDVDGGNIGLESDGTLTYNPSTGKVTATGFIGAIDGILGANSAAALTATTGVFSTSIDVTGSTGIILENDETITNSVNGTVLINGNLKVGSGSGAGVYASNGNYDVTLQTGNSTTGSITIVDGANGTITLSPNGSGTSVIEDPVLTVGSDADGDIYYRASNKLARLANGTDGQVLTSAGGTSAPAWEDAAAGGGTTQLGNFGKIPAGAPVAVYNDSGTAKATVISGMGNDVGPHGKITNWIQNGPSIDTRREILAIPGQGTGGLGALVSMHYDGSASTSTLNFQGGTVNADKTVTWGEVVALSINIAGMWNMAWDETDDRLVVFYRDAGDSGNGKVLVLELDANALAGGSGNSGTIYDDAAAGGTMIGLNTTSAPSIVSDGAGRMVCAYSVSSDEDFFVDVLNITGSSTNTAAKAFGGEVSQSGESAYLVKVAWGGGRGIVIYEDSTDSFYNFVRAIDHDGSNLQVGNQDELWGSDVTVDLGYYHQNNISYDSSNDNFVIAASHTDADGDHMPVVCAVSVAGTGTSATPTAGTMVKVLAAWESDHELSYSSQTAANDSVMYELNAAHTAIHYDPDRDVHLLLWRAHNYRGRFGENHRGGFYRFGGVMASNVITLSGTDDRTCTASNLLFHPARNLHSEMQYSGDAYANVNNINNFSMTYDTTNDVMFTSTNHTMIRRPWEGTGHSDDTNRHPIFPWLGNDTADGGTGALTYGYSNVSAMIGFNTTAITSTSGSTATITTAGGLNENQSSLTVGEKYYIADSGVLMTNRPEYSWDFMRAGVATAATKLLVVADSTTTS